MLLRAHYIFTDWSRSPK